jgi:hypothetical protein
LPKDIREALGPIDKKNVFTEAAAAELQERIERFVYALRAGDVPVELRRRCRLVSAQDRECGHTVGGERGSRRSP